ncbi:hypothetical protein B0H19DRAFT_1097577 [Mycena capillaripes]|nr:hypothetical protein B0H19DRAFT_1097577 [Mycena capillaripes]
MVASSEIAAPPQPIFPEDIERAINEVLLNDTGDMCGTMSLVASRFHIWNKPIMFHTIFVHRHNNWMKRIGDYLMPNASFIRILVLSLPLTRGPARLPSSAEELSLIRKLLEASGGIRHLAVTWNLWAQLACECGVQRIESLYLIWDRAAFNISAPSLHHLQHPEELVDLTVYAPADLCNPVSFPVYGDYLVPATTHCVNLAYVTYAADRMPNVNMAYLRLKGAILVVVGRTALYENEEGRLKWEKEMFPGNYSVVCVQNWEQVLAEWVAKMEGRESLLKPPVETAVPDNDRND